MCIKIVCSEKIKEFNPLQPLEDQISGRSKIVVNYDPRDPDSQNIDTFVIEMERLCKNGISCDLDISVNANDYIKGLRFKKKIESLKHKLEVNEVVKSITIFVSETDRKLSELSNMCLGKTE